MMITIRNEDPKDLREIQEVNERAFGQPQEADIVENLRRNCEEILSLVQGGVVDVGSHTMTHPVLATLPPERQLDEVRTGKRLLEEILGRPVTSFAYPFGSKADYSRQTAGIVRESGFECACSNFTDLVWRWTNLFQLPRVVVRNWPGELFSHKMAEWFYG